MATRANVGGQAITRSYFVHVDSRPLTAAFDDEMLDEFFVAVGDERRLAGPSAAFNTATQVLGLSTAVDSASAAQALQVAAHAFLRAGKRGGLKEVEIGEASVELDTGYQNDRQELVSGAEVARRLGVSRQRIAQLTAAKARFPRPVATLGIVSIWRWGQIADWAEVSGRRVARPHRRKAS